MGAAALQRAAVLGTCSIRWKLTWCGHCFRRRGLLERGPVVSGAKSPAASHEDRHDQQDQDGRSPRQTPVSQAHFDKASDDLQ